MPSIVDASSFSSLYAGTTTATRLPSSTDSRLRSRSAGEARRRLPQERGQDPQQQADQGADEDGVPLAAGGRLRRACGRDQLALLDVLGESEELLVLTQVVDHLPLFLEGEADQVADNQPLDRGPGRALNLSLERGDSLIDPGKLRLVRLDVRLQVFDLRRDVRARDLVDDDLGERVRSPGDLRPLLARDDDGDERVLADPAERCGHTGDGLRRDMAAKRAIREPGLLLGDVLPVRRQHDLLHRRGVRGEALDLPRAGWVQRLAEADRGLRLVDLTAAEREEIAEDDPNDEDGDGEPPTHEQRVPVAPELELLLGVDVRQTVV